MDALELQRLIFVLLLTIGVARILDWRGPNHKSHAMSSFEIFKEEKFVEQRYRRSFCTTKNMRSCGLVCRKLKMKMSKLVDVLNKLV